MKTKNISFLYRKDSVNRFKSYFLFIILIQVVFLLMGQTVKGQQKPNPIFFRNGNFLAERNILRKDKKDKKDFSKQSLHSVHYRNSYYALVQFDKLPDTRQKKELAGQGIRLFDYLPGQAFLAEMPDSFSTVVLGNYGVSAVSELPVRFKISSRLLQDMNGFAHTPDKLVAVSFFGSMDKKDVAAELEKTGATIIPTKIQPDRTLFIQATGPVLQRIAGMPFISYLAPQSLKDRPLNYNNRAAHGLDVLGAPSGRNLQGDGVTIGIGDNASPYTHVDFTGRLIERFPAPVDLHGHLTSGIVAGGGILNPQYKGMAPHARLVNQYFSDILVNTPAYVADFGMVLTNNSYTAYDAGCAWEGEYDVLSNYADAQLLAFPFLLHDFASGNDGQLTCTPYPRSFGTVKSGYQVAKNTLCIGNVDNTTYLISPNSSRGPSLDGRTKPEIVAGGENITSTKPYNNYGTYSGTSLSCPTVTGTLALLYQRYRQLHGNTNPTAALIKAIACNSATDLGNPGPDYTFGFGSLNARTAVETIENNHYMAGSVTNGNTQTFTLPGIPGGAQQIKILLYWPDAPAAPFAASALVNDLDLTVSSPDGALHHPLILNPDILHVNDIAIEGEDHLNNIEQIVINNPPGGNFTLSVTGSNVPAGSQDFVIIYQVITPSVTVEYPFGNETWLPSQPETIRWSAYGGDPNPFTLEYSPDNGSTWTLIDNAVPSDSRLYPWTTPAPATDKGLIRITRNGTGLSDISDYNFTILRQPNLTVTNPCQGYAQLSWTNVTSATGYDILQLKGDRMQTVANTTGTGYLLGNLRRDSSYWFAVRAVYNGSPGRPSVAATIIPAGSAGACALPALDKDITPDSLIAPLYGRAATSSALGTNTLVTVELKNLGTIPTSGPITLCYRVNGGTVVTETDNAVLSAGIPLNYAFSQPFDFSTPGTYQLQIWVVYPGDPQQGNDTLTATIKQLPNDPVTLNQGFTEDFETASAGEYTFPTLGLDGLDRWDFRTNNSNGRIRTFVNTGFARSGNRSATLDQVHFNPLSTADSLIGTFNLSGYSASDQIWLDFYYRNQGIDFTLPGNRVWIRGNDQANWIPVFTLDTLASHFGIFQPATSIDITGILSKALPVQTISSSFQLKFGEQGYTSANSVTPDGNLDDGYSFDDITLTRATKDISMVSLEGPVLSNICGLTNGETISVKVKNYNSGIATNIPVTYSVNGITVTEKIPSIKPFDSIVYQFAQTADLSAFQNYSIRAWVSFPGDNYSRNDTLSAIQFITTPLITSYPYLEGFEKDNGFWYTNGINDNWQWGTPFKAIISKAANGSKCWSTSLTGTYNNNELSYLNSPCFDLSSLANPMLSFSHIFQMEDNCDCDYHWVEYTTDGINWVKLGVSGNGTNWYDNSTRQAWQLSDTKWHVSSYPIPVHTAKVRFRIVMKSDPATNYEGIGIDDFHVFDQVPVYSGPNISNGFSQPVNGNNWINFDIGGQRVVSLNPNGQDLGNTQVKVFIDPGPVPNDGKQYYLNRNIVIKPANIPSGEVSVRFYFLDTEAGNLIDASGCATCTSIPDAYQSGIMQYSSQVLAQEDSTLNNDTTGTFRYLAAHRAVNVIPYDNGYYAQYRVNGFSEFWINTRPATDAGILPTLVSPILSNSCGLSNAETVRVKVKNYSPYDLANIPVTYSINGVAVTENIPVIAALDSVVYAFSQKADLSAYRKYDLSAWISYSGDNNTGNDSLTPVSIQTTPLISSFPYQEGFENNSGYWYAGGVNDSWQWGTPAKSIINKAAYGSKCWVTNLNGNYNPNEQSYLYSPCFDLSSLTSPVLSFNHIFRTADNCDCAYHWVEYSQDGATWIKLGVAGNGVSWYDYAPLQAWKISNTQWHISSYDIPTGLTSARFRIAFQTVAGTTYEGIGIDEILVSDKKAMRDLVVNLYPNPVLNGTLFIFTSAICEAIQLTDVSGRIVLRENAHGFLNTLYLGSLAKGIYFVRVQTGSGTRVQKIFIR
ncbi:S8 family serine peptidase [Flavitalea flava]